MAHYHAHTDIDIQIVLGISVSGYTDVEMFYEKPDYTKGSFVLANVIVNDATTGDAEVALSAATNDQDGVWKWQLKFTLSDGKVRRSLVELIKFQPSLTLAA